MSGHDDDRQQPDDESGNHCSLHLFDQDDDPELAPTPGRRRGRVRSPKGPASPGHYATYGDGKGLLFGKIAGSFWFRRNRPDRNQGKLW